MTKSMLTGLSTFSRKSVANSPYFLENHISFSLHVVMYVAGSIILKEVTLYI